jgi:AcrR family transcriptional regulator
MHGEGLTRLERKQRTREALLEAALMLTSQRGSFASVSLREVAREAGVVPTAFYRHFRDMDELGLALVADVGEWLRRLLREARAAGLPDVDMVRRSVRAYLSYLSENRQHVLFIASERTGGSPALRRAVREELDRFAREMAHDLRSLDFLPHLLLPTLELVCAMVVHTMISAAPDILDSLEEDEASQERRVEGFVFQLRLIFLGAGQWKEPEVP